MAIIGLIARVEACDRPQAVTSLNDLPGVSVFDVNQSDQVGLLIEAPNMDEAHHCVRQQIEQVDGVLCAWPVYASIEDELEEACTVSDAVSA